MTTDTMQDQAENVQKAMTPESKNHTSFKEYVVARLESSAEQMTEFQERWTAAENRHQAYFTLPEWEEAHRVANNNGQLPKITRFVVPYSFSIVQTVVTYLMNAFTSGTPMFSIQADNLESIEPARGMEQKLQYDVRKTRAIVELRKFLLGSQLYGVGSMFTYFAKEEAYRTRKLPSEQIMGMASTNERREVAITYEGNRAMAIDVFNFFPDPSVPMHMCPKDGEFMFYATSLPRQALEQGELDGTYFNISAVPREFNGNTKFLSHVSSQRARRSGGESHPDRYVDRWGRQQVTLHHGTIDIVPANFGLSKVKHVERWRVTLANGSTIIQAQPFHADHGMHPFVVAEPNNTGFEFGALALADYMAPIQDALSWLLNSHVENVRVSINNQFVVDPNMIEVRDLKSPGAGKIIRLKNSAFGQDVRTAITQLPVADLTRGHIDDIETVMRLGQYISGVSDNRQGMQDIGGRKTATEIRAAYQSGDSRLADLASHISAQAISPWAEQMSANNQQYLSRDFFYRVIGADGQDKDFTMRPEQLVGDFVFPVFDGTMPVDKVALLDIWIQGLQLTLQDQELRQAFSIPKMFEYIAKLGGIKNIEDMRRMPENSMAVAPDGEIQDEAAKGNLVSAAEVTQTNNGDTRESAQEQV